MGTSKKNNIKTSSRKIRYPEAQWGSCENGICDKILILNNKRNGSYRLDHLIFYLEKKIQ